MQTITSLSSPFTQTRTPIRISSQSIGWISLLVMILAGSTNPAFGKQLSGSFSPFSMLFISEVLMFFFALLTFGFVPMIRKTIALRRSTIGTLILVGSLNGAAAPLLWFNGLSQTTAVNAQLFGMTEMLFLMAFACFFANERLTRSNMSGALVIVTGILLVALRGFSEKLVFNPGDLAIIAACFSFGIGETIIRTKLRHVEPELIIMVRSSVAIAFFFAVSPFLSHPFIDELREFPMGLLPVLFAYGLISRFLQIFSFYEAIERLPVTTVSLLSTLVVGTATWFAHAYLGEAIHWYHIAGGGLIILGAMVVQQGSIRKLEHRWMNLWKTRNRVAGV